jgi:hypothetical protein
LSEPARTPTDQRPPRRAGPTDGAGEPELGIHEDPGRGKRPSRPEPGHAITRPVRSAPASRSRVDTSTTTPAAERLGQVQTAYISSNAADLTSLIPDVKLTFPSK